MTAPKPNVPPIDEHAKIALEAWKKVVQTQEHFNEICMKVRTLYATVLAAILSLYGVFLKDSSDSGLKVAGLHFDAVMIVCIVVFVATTLFYFVDKEWYHRLLLGAVAQGAEIENRWANILPEIQLGAKITDKSPVDLSDRRILVWFLKLFVKDQRFVDQNKLHSDAKVEVFYKPIQWLAVWFFVLALFFGGLTYNDQSLAGLAWANLKECWA